MTAHSLTLLNALSASAASEDGTRHLGRGKPVALLAYLSAAPGRRASRERLATLLWSEGSSEQARQNLRQTLWYIRRRLGDWLIATDEFVELIPEVRTDRDAFLDAVGTQALDRAIELYAGEFIPDFAAPGAAAFEEWVELERRRLRALFVGCCDTIARQALGEGRFARAAELARRARDASPQELGSWRLLLETLIASRDAVAGLAEAEHLDALAAAGEVELDDLTRALLRSARALSGASGGNGAGRVSNGSASGVASAASNEPEPSTLAPELIGREAEFRRLLEHWDAARQGQGRTVLVTAVAGLGKTRLLADLHARLRASRGRAALIRANPGDRAVASGFLAALAELVAQRPGAAAISPESASVLVELAPALASSFSAARPDAASGEDALRRRVGALLDLLRAVSEDAPFALLVDDLHWADPDSRRVLEAIAARLDGTRILLVLAARPPVEALGGFAGIERIDLPRLDLPRVAEFVTRLGELPTDDWATELPAQLLTATRGVPLTIIEALQRLLEADALSLQGQRWTSAAPERIAALLAEGMVLEARLRTLSPGAREVLLVLAVLGRPMSALHVLEAISDAASADDPRLLELEHRGFVGRHGPVAFVTHDEIADAAVAGATAGDRKAAQACAALALLRDRHRESPLRLAFEHAQRAEDPRLMHEVVRAWILLRRGQGDTRSVAMIVGDIVGRDLPLALRRSLVRQMPWWQRPSAWTRRGVLAVLALALPLGVWASTRRVEEPEYVAYIKTQGESPQLLRVDVPAGGDWDAAVPLVARPVKDGELPLHLLDRQATFLTRLPDGRSWVGKSFFPDSGGDEVVVVEATGELRRPVSSIGDDGFKGLSPDGRKALVVSARWNADVDRYNIGVLDLGSGELRRMFASRAHDRSASWSPDGTRIAFLRHRFERDAPDELCVGSADGAEHRCDFAAGVLGSGEVSWVDERRVLLMTHEGSAILVDVLDGRVSPVGASGALYFTSSHPRLRLVASEVVREGERELSLARVDERLSHRPIRFRGHPVDGDVVADWAFRNARYLDSIAIVVPAEGVPLDQPYRLRVSGWAKDGSPVPVHALRYASLDPDVALVENGVLRPQRLGRLRVVASAGGWRADTAVVEVVPSNAETLLREDWSASWPERWRPFGDPAPYVERGSLFPNGDGRYNSGVYALRILDASRGLGVEAQVSIPFTDLYQWQMLSFTLSADLLAAERGAWDHVTGFMPLTLPPTCSASYGGDGARTRKYMGLSAGAEVLSGAVPPELGDGRVFTLRLQLFPDGRCGLAVNGRAVTVSARGRAVTAPQLLTLVAYSEQTRVRVGAVEVWSGVRGGVDWTGVR